MRLYEHLEDLWMPRWLEGVSCNTTAVGCLGHGVPCVQVRDLCRGCGVGISLPEIGSTRPVAGDETRHNAETSDQRRR
jgi:hypothetical protein